LWQVPLEEEEGFGDIVKFYNKVFIPKVKNFILQAQPGGAAHVPNSIQSVLSPLRKRVSAKANVFLSPLRKAATPQPMTPKTKEKYMFGDHHSAVRTRF